MADIPFHPGDRCTCCGQLVPAGGAPGARCPACGLIDPCACGGDINRARRVMVMTINMYLTGYMHAQETFARFRAAGRHDLLRIAREEIGAIDREMAAEAWNPDGPLEDALGLATHAFAAAEARDAAAEMLRLAQE